MYFNSIQNNHVHNVLIQLFISYILMKLYQVRNSMYVYSKYGKSIITNQRFYFDLKCCCIISVNQNISMENVINVTLT